MVSVRPWCKEAENIFDRLSKDGIAYTSDIKLPREFGMKCKDLISGGFLDIARVERKQKSVFIKPPEIIIFPKLDTNKKIRFHFEKLRL